MTTKMAIETRRKRGKIKEKEERLKGGGGEEVGKHRLNKAVNR